MHEELDHHRYTSDTFTMHACLYECFVSCNSFLLVYTVIFEW